VARLCAKTKRLRQSDSWGPGRARVRAEGQVATRSCLTRLCCRSFFELSTGPLAPFPIGPWQSPRSLLPSSPLVVKKKRAQRQGGRRASSVIPTPVSHWNLHRRDHQGELQAGWCPNRPSANSKREEPPGGNRIDGISPQDSVSSQGDPGSRFRRPRDLRPEGGVPRCQRGVRWTNPYFAAASWVDPEGPGQWIRRGRA